MSRDKENLAKAVEILRAKRFPCPVEGCTFRAYKEEGLFGHLYERHRKVDLIRAILELLREGGGKGSL